MSCIRTPVRTDAIYSTQLIAAAAWLQHATDSPGKSGKAKRAEAALHERARQQQAPMAVAALANDSSWSLGGAFPASSNEGDDGVADSSARSCCSWPCCIGRRYEMVEPVQEVRSGGRDGTRMNQ